MNIKQHIERFGATDFIEVYDNCRQTEKFRKQETTLVLPIEYCEPFLETTAGMSEMKTNHVWLIRKKKSIYLESVGSYVINNGRDADPLVYPAFKDGGYDPDACVPLKDCEADWAAALSDEDLFLITSTFNIKL